MFTIKAGVLAEIDWPGSAGNEAARAADQLAQGAVLRQAECQSCTAICCHNPTAVHNRHVAVKHVKEAESQPMRYFTTVVCNDWAYLPWWLQVVSAAKHIQCSAGWVAYFVYSAECRAALSMLSCCMKAGSVLPAEISCVTEHSPEFMQD